MKITTKWQCYVASFCALVIAAVPDAAAKSLSGKPHLVFLLADDLGYK